MDDRIHYFKVWTDREVPCAHSVVASDSDAALEEVNKIPGLKLAKPITEEEYLTLASRGDLDAATV